MCSVMPWFTTFIVAAVLCGRRLLKTRLVLPTPMLLLILRANRVTEQGGTHGGQHSRTSLSPARLGRVSKKRPRGAMVRAGPTDVSIRRGERREEERGEG